MKNGEIGSVSGWLILSRALLVSKSRCDKQITHSYLLPINRAMERFAELTVEGRKALLAGDHAGLADLMDANFK